MLAADGRIVWLRDIVTVVVEHDQPVMLRGVMVDISEQKRMEQELRNSEAQYRAVFEATTDGLTINTLDGALLEVNPAFAAMHGYTRAEMAGMDPRTFIHPDYHAQTPQAFRAFAAGREFTEVFAHDVRRDGSAFPVEAHGVRFMYRGEPHVLCIVRDISAHRQAEEAIQRSERRYEDLVNSLDSIVWEWEDNAGTQQYTFVSKQAERLLGYPVARWRSGFLYDHLHPDDREATYAYMFAAMAERRSHELEYRVLAADGRVVWFRDIISVAVDPSGVVKMRGTMIDITAQKRIQQDCATAKSNTGRSSRPSPMAWSSPTWPATCRRSTPLSPPNSATRPEELVGMDPRNWVHADSQANLAAFLEQVGAGERYYTEGKQVRKDGTVFPAEVYGTPFLYTGRRHTLAIIHDITERAQAQDLLEQRVAERTRELAALAQVASQVAFGGSLQSTFGVLCRRVVEVTGGLAASVVLRDGSQQRMVGTWGLPDGYAAAMNRILEAGTQMLTQAAFAGQRPVSITDMRRALLGNPAYAPIHGFVAAAAWDTVVAVPMVYRDGAVGVLLSYHPPAYRIDETQLSFHTAIADQAAIAVGNARLLAEAQETTRKTAALAQVASQVAFGGSLQATLDMLCRRVVEAAGSLAAAVVLREEGQLRIFGSYGLPAGYPAALNQVLDSGTPLMTQPALEGQKPVVVANARAAMLNNPAYAPAHRFLAEVPWDILVAVPMVSRDQAVGALLSYYPPTHEVDATAMTFHTVIADQAAVAVENARLLQQANDKARLEERQRLARELHNSVTQALFSISLIARSAELLLQREGTHSEATMEKLADLRQLTQGALAEMRALIFELRPGALEEEGLLEALRKHAAAVQGRELLQVDVRAPAPDALPRLKPAAEEALYRITQEALHNVVKHAGATRVEVEIQAQAGFVVLRVGDDGAGFDPATVPAGHMGLGTMRERTQALGGEYRIASRPGAGTTLTVRVPLAEWQL